MVSAPESAVQQFELWPGALSFVFLGKTHNSHGASLRPGV